MNKRFMSAMLSLSVAATMCSGFAVTAQAAEAKTPTYQTTARQMEDLSRGLIAVKTTASDANGIEGGVYLSWRLLGTESLENQAFDIYKNDVKIYTTGTHDATCYTDTTGTAADTYKVVKAGASATEVAAETAATPITTTGQANDSLVNDGTSEKNAFAYIDVPIQIPDDVSRMGDGKTSTYKRGSDGNGANDASVGDLDGDGDYEIVLKWDPADSKDSAGADYTGNVYIDGYEITTDTDNLMWRIDLGQNVTAGAHYTQFMVYDLDGDGKSEVAMKTAPGSIDGTGHYVSEVGDSAEIRNVDNTKSYIGTSGGSKGKNLGPEYLTIFDGETGAAMYTTDFIPLGTSSEWGDSKYNRAERFLAGIAYLDGVHPSLIMCRGYYAKAVVRAYSWDGDALNMTWEYNSGQTSGSSSLYGQGNHNLSIGDIDDDGYDEIVYGSAALDHDGKTVLGNTQLGHGDAIHMSDFNNDGVQEVFSVKEDQYKKYAEDLRVASTGTHFWSSGKIVTDDDNGRGVMDNIDDAYASTHEKQIQAVRVTKFSSRENH
jgi:rhamnogalacturonan endolyase